jgi:thioredoxin-related protein
MKSLNSLLIFFITIFVSSQAYGQGQIVGGKESVHPDWFKESFLEIAADVEEAADEDKHVMLFIHLNGCPYCYKMIEENIKHAPYTDYIREHFDVIALNMLGDREVMMDDETSLTEKELATQLKVVYTPTILFLNAENKVVARINGYRSVPDFKLVLTYVQEKAYKKITLAQYLDSKKKPIYVFRDHPQIQEITNLQSAADKPLAVLFEDQGCFDCSALHDGHLANPEIRKILDGFTLVRLDALSDQKITDVEGNATTAREYTEKLGLTYRPGIVLFDQGKEIMRIQGMLYSYHFSEVLRYVGERHYQKYPDDFYDYLDVKTAALLEKG